MLNKTSAKENQINRADTNWICEGRTWPISYYETHTSLLELNSGGAKYVHIIKIVQVEKNYFRFMHCHLTKASFCQARTSSSILTRRKDSKTVRLRPPHNVLICWMEMWTEVCRYHILSAKHLFTYCVHVHRDAVPLQILHENHGKLNLNWKRRARFVTPPGVSRWCAVCRLAISCAHGWNEWDGRMDLLTWGWPESIAIWLDSVV